MLISQDNPKRLILSYQKQKVDVTFIYFSFFGKYMSFNYGIAISLSTFANCRSQFLLDRLGKCLKLIVSSRGTSCHEFTSQFGLEFFYTRKNRKPQPAAVDLRSAADKQLNWNGHNPFSWVAQRQELSAKTLLQSAAIREQYMFHLLFAINKVYF